MSEIKNKKAFAAPGRYIQGDGVFRMLGELAGRFGNSPYILMGPTPRKIYGEQIKMCIRDSDKVPCGRVNLQEVEAWARKTNFEGIELSMSEEEAIQEASRCLRCDRHGCGVLRGGREVEW